MAEVGPIGYKITCDNGENPPYVRYLVPPAPGAAREDQFYAIAGGNDYMVRLMRPHELKERGRSDTPVSSPEVVASYPGHNEFTSRMIRSCGLTYRAINQGVMAEADKTEEIE